MKLLNLPEPVTSTARRIQPTTIRKSGLTDLQLTLMGKGPAARLRRLMTPAECDAWANRRSARGGA